MKEFMEWAFSLEAPDWVGGLVMVLIAVLALIYGLTALVALLLGYWIVSVIMMIVAPMYMIAREYEKHRKGRDQ